VPMLGMGLIISLRHNIELLHNYDPPTVRRGGGGGGGSGGGGYNYSIPSFGGDGTHLYCSDRAYYLGTDNRCHSYALHCPGDYYLGTDNKCHSNHPTIVHTCLNHDGSIAHSGPCTYNELHAAEISTKKAMKGFLGILQKQADWEKATVARQEKESAAVRAKTDARLRAGIGPPCEYKCEGFPPCRINCGWDYEHAHPKDFPKVAAPITLEKAVPKKVAPKTVLGRVDGYRKI
jgi:hypothetical protein